MTCPPSTLGKGGGESRSGAPIDPLTLALSLRERGGKRARKLLRVAFYTLVRISPGKYGHFKRGAVAAR
jgi:hypothetical protein